MHTATGGSDSSTMSGASPLRDIGEHRVRLMEQEAQLNPRTALESRAESELRCSENTSRSSAVTVRTVDSYLAHGDFYGDPIAAFAWPLLIQAGGLADYSASSDIAPVGASSGLVGSLQPGGEAVLAVVCVHQPRHVTLELVESVRPLVAGPQFGQQAQRAVVTVPFGECH